MIYMGVARLAATCALLLAAGMRAKTAPAAIKQGTLAGPGGSRIDRQSRDHRHSPCGRAGAFAMERGALNGAGCLKKGRDRSLHALVNGDARVNHETGNQESDPDARRAT